MVSGINNIEQSTFQPQLFQGQPSTTDKWPERMNSFDDEDKAIISSQAKMLNELDKFNAGEGNPVDLALSCVIAKNTASAEVNVINAKKDMIDVLLDLGK